jgi:hypothetical protein
MKTRLYIITTPNDPKTVRLVEAGSQAQALRHVMAEYEVNVASAMDVARLSRDGVMPELIPVLEDDAKQAALRG